MTTEIELKGKIPENPIIIEGFPSVGFVSTIATKYMMDELGMKLIGWVNSDGIRSVAIVHDSKPMRPIRIYRKDNLILLFSEVNIPMQYAREFSQALREWFRKIKPEKVILLAGIHGKTTEKEHEIFGISNDSALTKELSEMNVEIIEEGILSGISSDLLLDCIDDNIPAISLMAETRYMPDPLGAASMLDILNKILKLNMDVKKLAERGKEIEGKFREIAEQLKKGKDKHEEMSEYSPMYM